ncbi:MAG: cache domain-containing protein [Gemmatimonadota bacterium]
MADVDTRTLQVRLLILVLLAFIPALALFWYTNREIRELQMNAAEQELAQRAQVLATEYRSLLDQSQDYLATLAEFPEIRSGPPSTCNTYLSRSFQHLKAYTTISLIGMDGYFSCGAMTPESELYLGDRAYFVRATSRESFSVGEFALGRISGLPVVGVALPLFRDGRLTGVLAASLDLNLLARRVSANGLPEGHTFTVLDRGGRVMVRLPTTGTFTLADSVGAMADVDFPEMPEGRGATVVEGTDMDGMERLFAVAPLRGSAGEAQGYLAFGRTRATLMEEVDAMVEAELRFLAIGALVLLALAWILGHFWVAKYPED